MALFQKKAAFIEAEQWHPGKHVDGVRDGMCGAEQVKPGDWIVTGADGTRFIYAGNFLDDYEPVTSSAQEMWDFLNPQRAHPPGT